MIDRRFADYPEHVFVPVAKQTGCATCGYARGHHPTARQLAAAENPRWLDDRIQFPRLLAELLGVGLSESQYAHLRASMDLTTAEIDELMDRADTAWERIRRPNRGDR